MLYLLNPKVWIAAALLVAAVVSHSVAYRTGKAVVAAQWQQDKLIHAEATRKQQEAFRAKEQELLAAKQESEVRYVELKKRYDRSIAGARVELDGLRNDLAARDRAASQDPATLARAVGGAGLERELLGQCATALVGVAAEADRLEAQLVGLVSYVKNVCMKATP